MKKTLQLFVMLAAVTAAMTVSSCKSSIFEFTETPVENVTLDASLAGGVELEIGDEMSIAGMVTVAPINAQDRAEYFFSSNTDVAIVSAEGKITAVGIGKSIITITVSNIDNTFELTVIPERIVPLKSINFSSDLIKMDVGDVLDLATRLTFEPAEAAKDVVIAVENTTVATLDGKMITAVAKGETKVIASSLTNPSLKAETTIGVPTGDLDRTSWSIVASQDLSKWTSAAEKNGYTSAIDDDMTTIFCQVRPGKSYGGIKNDTDELWFYIDLGQEATVNYFRIAWRYEAKELFCRVYMFDQVLGSNNATDWTVLESNIYTGAENDAQLSEKLFITKGTYRYYKFVYNSVTSYTNPVTNEVRGSSSQINEIYLGLDEYYKPPVVHVESVNFDSELKSGTSLKIGTTMSLAGRYTILPANATEKDVKFSSSSPSVASVSSEGLINGLALGSTTITVEADGKSDSFDLEVVSGEIAISEIKLADDIKNGAEIAHTGSTLDISSKVTVLPLDTTEDKTIAYESSNPKVATIDASGVITAVAIGEADITVKAGSKSSKFTVKVKAGDYDRTGWTASASIDISGWSSAAEKNSLLSPLDGDLTTNFCLVRPGKSFASISTPADADLWFVINMGEKKTVDSFRIIWRYENKEQFCRFFFVEEILGSNDGVNYTSIARNVSLQGDNGNEMKRDTPIISIPETEYQYYKFVTTDPVCWTFPTGTTPCPWTTGGNPRGGSNQFSEIYLGNE